MKEVNKEEVLNRLHKEFRTIVEEHQYMEVDPPLVVARFVFYAAIMYKIGMDEHMDYWLKLGKDSNVELITKDEAKKYVN